MAMHDYKLCLYFRTNVCNAKRDSNKDISSKINHPTEDLTGFIDGIVALSIGLEECFYSVYQNYNSGNTTQLFIPIDEGNALWVRGFHGNTIVYLRKIQVSQ